VPLLVFDGSNSPALEARWTRAKKILLKLGKKPAKKLYDFIVDVARGTAKKKLDDYIP